MQREITISSNVMKNYLNLARQNIYNSFIVEKS